MADDQMADGRRFDRRGELYQRAELSGGADRTQLTPGPGVMVDRREYNLTDHLDHLDHLSASRPALFSLLILLNSRGNDTILEV